MSLEMAYLSSWLPPIVVCVVCNVLYSDIDSDFVRGEALQFIM